MSVFNKQLIQRKLVEKIHISNKLFNKLIIPRYFSHKALEHESLPYQSSDPKAWSWTKYFKKSKSFGLKKSKRLSNNIIATSEQLDHQLGPQIYHNGYIEQAHYTIISSFLKTVTQEVALVTTLKEQEVPEPNDIPDPASLKSFRKIKSNRLDDNISKLQQIISIFDNEKSSTDNCNSSKNFANNFQPYNQKILTALNYKNYSLIQDFRIIVTHPSWKISTLEKINQKFENNMAINTIQRSGKLFDILNYKINTILSLIQVLQSCDEFLNDKLIFFILKNFNSIDLFQNYSVILHYCLINNKHLTVPEYLFNELLINTIQSKSHLEFKRLSSLFINDISYSKAATKIKKIDFNNKIWDLIFNKTLNKNKVTTNYVQTFENTYNDDYLTDICPEEDEIGRPVFLRKIQYSNNNLIPPAIKSNSLFKARLDFTNYSIPNSKNFFYQKLKPDNIRLLRENSINSKKPASADENTVIQKLSFCHGNFHQFNTISLPTAVTLLKGCLKFHELELFDLFIEKIIMDSYFLSYDNDTPRLRIRVSNRVELDKKLLAVNNLNFEPLALNNKKVVNTDIEKIYNLDLLNLYLLRLRLDNTEMDDSLVGRFNWVKNIIETVYIRPITIKYVAEINNLFVSDRKTFSKKYNNIFNKDDIIKLEIFNCLKNNSYSNSQTSAFIDFSQTFKNMKDQRDQIKSNSRNKKVVNDYDLYLDKDTSIDLETMKNLHKTAMHLKQFEMIDFFEEQFFISWKHVTADENSSQKDVNTGDNSNSNNSFGLNIKKLLSL